jgi:hypothetical protein
MFEHQEPFFLLVYQAYNGDTTASVAKWRNQHVASSLAKIQDLKLSTHLQNQKLVQWPKEILDNI